MEIPETAQRALEAESRAGTTYFDKDSRAEAALPALAEQ